MCVLGLHARRSLWWLLLLLSLANVAVLVTLASVYLASETPQSLLWVVRVYYLYFDANQFLIRYGKSVLATGYALQAALWLVAQELVHRNKRIRTMALRLSCRLSNMLKSRASFLSLSSNRFHWCGCFQRCWTSLHRLHRACGVHGLYFDARLLLEELLELAAQTIVAYSSSQSISNVLLNQLYGLLIFANSISGLVLQRLLNRHNVVTQRLACLMSDIVLDFVWGTLLPAWSWLPLLAIYQSTTKVGDNIGFAVNSGREVERVLVLSLTNFALSVIPFLNSCFSILELLAVLHSSPVVSSPSPPHVAVKSSTQVAPFTKPQEQTTTILLVPCSDSQSTKMTKSPSLSLLSIQPRLGRGRVIFVMRVLMACYGTVILFVSLSANGFLGAFPSHSQFECRHRVNPWLATQEACIGRTIRCSAVGITGTNAEISRALDLFDAASLSDLFVIDCTELEIPSSVLRFTRLQSLVIKHSTLAGWEDGGGDPALSITSFTDLKTLNMNNVSLGANPDTSGSRALAGLLHYDLSPSVEWVHLQSIAFSDQWLLQPLYERQLWRHLLYFDCDDCGLSTLPSILRDMDQLVAVCLADNDLAEILHEDWQLLPHVEALWLDDNPRLAELPDSVWHTATSQVSMAHTKLSVVPPWLAARAQPGFVLTASGTPLCESNNGALTSELQAIVSCDP